MTKTRNIIKLVLAAITFIAGLSILASLIYLFIDYERNVMLDLMIDDYILLFMIVALIFFMLLTFLFYRSFLKNKKSLKN